MSEEIANGLSQRQGTGKSGASAGRVSAVSDAWIEHTPDPVTSRRQGPPAAVGAPHLRASVTIRPGPIPILDLRIVCPRVIANRLQTDHFLSAW